jgi:hypothetical protein
MLSWKEYPRTTGGLSRYLSWFKDFRRPKDLHRAAGTEGEFGRDRLFGRDYEKTKKLYSHDLE